MYRVFSVAGKAIKTFPTQEEARAFAVSTFGSCKILPVLVSYQGTFRDGSSVAQAQAAAPKGFIMWVKQ